MGHSAAITKKATRRKLDQYFTPASATETLITEVPIYGGILECCAGDSGIADVLETMSEVQVWRNDLDQNMPRLDHHGDATNPLLWHWMTDKRSVSWVISNPPFDQAARIIPLAYKNALVGVAMLLRLSYLEPTKDRGAWLNEHPPTRMIVLPRISFTGDGKTDSVTCAWMVWEKYAKGTIKIAKNPKFEKHSSGIDRASRRPLVDGKQ